MTHLVLDGALSAEMAAWAAARIPHVGAAGFGPCWAIGVAQEGMLAAVVVFHDYQPMTGTVQLSMASASPRWITRQLVGRILALAFEGRLGTPVRKVWVAIPSTSQRVVELNARLGLKPEAKIRNHFAHRVSAVVCGIMRNEWLKLYKAGA